MLASHQHRRTLQKFGKNDHVNVVTVNWNLCNYCGWFWFYYLTRLRQQDTLTGSSSQPAPMYSCILHGYFILVFHNKDMRIKWRSHFALPNKNVADRAPLHHWPDLQYLPERQGRVETQTATSRRNFTVPGRKVHKTRRSWYFLWESTST